MVERGDAVRDVERPVGERQALAVGLHAEERADSRLVERASAEPDLAIGEDVGRDVRAPARDHVRAPQHFAAPTSSTRIPGWS